MEEINNAYYDALNSDDTLTVTIKGAIFIEYEINRLIDNLTVSKLALGRAKLTFIQNINIAIALGFPERFFKPLQRLAEIRNKYAHNIDYKIERKTIVDLYNLFSDEDKRVFLNSYKYTKKRDSLPKDPLTLEPLQILKLCLTTLRGAVVVAVRETTPS